MRLFYVLELLALGLWSGAAVGFGLIAPTFFSLIESRQLAGEVAGASLTRLETFGLTLAVIALWALTARARTDASPSRRYRWFVVLAMLALILADARVVHRKLDAIQARMDRPIEQYERTDPLRAEYGRWHGISMLIGTAAAGLGVIALAWGAASPPLSKEVTRRHG